MRIGLPTIILALVPLLGACTQSSKLSQADLCRLTVENYATLRDDPSKSAEYAAVFTKNGSFTLGPNSITGRDALMKRHKTANKDVNFNHVMDDIDIRTNMTGKSRVVVYTSARHGSHDINRVIIADYMDRFELENGQCLIAERNVAVLFDTNSARIIPTGK